MARVSPGTPIRKISGRAIPKPANDQNTDDIVPARYLKEITFARMGEYAYYDERFKDGKPVQNHPFNDARFKGANILVGGANYGCGSSREQAPQALQRYGISAIIAESFAEIFAGNCASLGVVGVTVPAGDVAYLAKLAETSPQSSVVIDLESKQISAGGKTIAFGIPEGRRRAFLDGTWDAMAILQADAAGIAAAERRLEYLRFK